MKYDVALREAKRLRSQGIEAETAAHKAVVEALANIDYKLASESLALAAQIRGSILVWDRIIEASTAKESETGGDLN